MARQEGKFLRVPDKLWKSSTFGDSEREKYCVLPEARSKA
jgi:hypothetical protein